MSNTEIAKNLLEGNTCDICCFKITNRHLIKDTCKKKLPFEFLPDENTCELFWAWEDEYLK